MINKPIKAVTEFHKAFGLSVEYKPKADLSSDITELRYNLMKEENEEYLQAVKSNDLIEIGDALGDMLYILCVTILSHFLLLIMFFISNLTLLSNLSG